MSLALVLGALSLATSAAADSTGEEILRAMREGYEGRWPLNVTFVQTTTFYEGDSTRAETWFEAFAPGKLRIDIAPVENGNGLIFRNDSLYQFQSDSLVAAVPQVHPLLVLSRDVYDLPVEETAAKLRALGFDLTNVRGDTWQGRPAIVVGAAPGDLTSPQFWVDKERLVFVRLLQPTRQNPAKIAETQFNEYRELGDGWIETEVVFLVDGRRVIVEEYDRIEHGVEQDEALFDPGRWGPPAWVVTPQPVPCGRKHKEGQGEKRPEKGEKKRGPAAAGPGEAPSC